MAHIVITGASHGIGAATARAFAKLPNTKLSLISRNTEKLSQVADECNALGADASFFKCDLYQEAQVQETGKTILEKYGTPNAVINNAGGFEPGDIRSTSSEQFHRQIDVNLSSAFLVTKAFIEPMIEAKSGTLFYVASVAALGPYPRGLAYSVAKHALVGLARGIREDTKDLGIRVTTLFPGAVLTPTWGDTDIPEERFIPADDIAKSMVDVYQLSDRTVVEEILLRPQAGDI